MQLFFIRLTFVVFLINMLAQRALAQSTPTSLIRFPNASADSMVFVAYGNLWTIDQSGGVARRLTDDPGQAIFPRYSPNARWIAFTATRAGAEDVYVVAARGGTARRLTYRTNSIGEGSSHDNMVVAWTPNSKYVVFLSRRVSWHPGDYRLFQVAVDGGLPTSLPLDHAGLITFAPDGTTIAYNRSFENFNARKRYDGGQAQNIFTYGLKSRRLERLTDWKGTDTSPMWYGRRLYFLSDRDANRRANVWVYDFLNNQIRQVTHFTDYDIDFPSLGAQTIAFQQGGRLYEIDLPSEKLHEISVRLPDHDAHVAARQISVGNGVLTTDLFHNVQYDLSPDGERALFSSRGELFSLSADGTARALTPTGGVDREHGAWSPDGSRIAYTTDESGEQQVAVMDADGRGSRTLTKFSAGYFFTPRWSPDGAMLVFGDAAHNLWLLRADATKLTHVAQDPVAEIFDAHFSTDGAWLAYSTVRSNQMRAIDMYHVASGIDSIVSSPLNDEHDPVFSPDGIYLYFVSSRTAQPLSSESDNSNIATIKSDGIYIAVLDRAKPSPFVSHAVPLATPASRREQSSDGSRIDLAGPMSRVVPIPMEPTNVASMDARGDQLFYLTTPPSLISGAFPGESAALHVFDLHSLSNTVLVTGLDSFRVSGDGTKALSFRGHIPRLTSIGSPNAWLTFNLEAMRATIDPRQEWSEMYREAWRLERDVFFNPTMDGVDWIAVRDRYAKLLPQLGSRDDLTYLLRQMLGELASSHIFLGSGDNGDRRDDTGTALFGADYELDAVSGRYRFAKIYAGDNSRPLERSPLSGPGMDVHERDYLLAVNGRELSAPMDPDALSLGCKGPETLTIARSARGPRRAIVVDPLGSEDAVRKLDWIEHNRRFVDGASQGQVGYVFLSDFFYEGTQDLVRQYYPQIDKRAMIFDVRFNRGGFTSQFVLDEIRKKLAGFFLNREGYSSKLPSDVMSGPVIALTNGFSASDGDQFPYYLSKTGVGEVLGTRTWGGVRGIDGSWPLIDGGSMTVPKDGLYDAQGQWIIENYGSEPDFEVDNFPSDAALGRDRQLEAAVKMLDDDVKRHPIVPVVAPPYLPAYPQKGDVRPSSIGSAKS